MGKAITPMGKKWEYLHSIWIIWLLFPFGFFSFISFFYISLRVKKRKWFIAGVIYLLLVVQFFIIDEVIPQENVIYDLSVMLLLAGWIAAWVHVFLLRKTYLRLLAQKQTSTQDMFAQNDAYSWGSTSPSEDTSASMEQQVPYSQQVNMNTAAKEEMMTIPSIEDIFAGQIVEIRRRRGPFQGFSHFAELMDMEPHMLAQSKPFMIFKDKESWLTDDYKYTSIGRDV